MEESYIKYIRKLVGNNLIILNSATVVIVNENNQILLQKRSDNLMWGLPGGLIELNETLEEAAIREVKEETNLDINISNFLGVFVNPLMIWNNTDKAKVFSFGFVGEVISGNLRVNDDESLELKYFSYDDIPVIHSKDNKDIINAYYNGKSNLVEGKNYNGNE